MNALSDLAGGRAWGQWQWRDFDGLRAVDASAAARTALLRDPATGLASLRAIQDFYLKYELQAVEGVSEVASVGGFEKQYQVVVDPQRLAAYGVGIGEVRDALAELEERLGREGIEVTVHDFVRGNEPAEDVIEVAEREDAALIVIGLRRRSPVGKLLMGSNAQDILLRAACPVLAVKAR